MEGKTETLFAPNKVSVRFDRNFSAVQLIALGATDKQECLRNFSAARE